jgi:hypothetical protein
MTSPRERLEYDSESEPLRLLVETAKGEQGSWKARLSQHFPAASLLSAIVGKRRKLNSMRLGQWRQWGGYPISLISQETFSWIWRGLLDLQKAIETNEFL